MSFLLDVPELRAARRERVQLPGRGHAPAGAASRRSRELTDYVYFRDNVAGRAARVVVPPRRLRRLVRRRARHAHERGAGHRDPAAARGAAPRLPSTRPSDAARPQPGERIDRVRPVAFTFDGEPVDGFAGDTIGSALFASGRRVFSRSFKYHRPRGLLCCSGRCPNCLMTVDGVPNVRVCVEPLRDGRGRARAERPRLARPRPARRSPTSSAGRSRRSASTTAR